MHDGMELMHEEKRTSALRNGEVFYFFYFSSFYIDKRGDDGHNADRSVLFVSSRFRGRGLKEELVTKFYNLEPKERGKRIVELQSIARKIGCYEYKYRHGRTIQGSPQQSRKAKKTKAQRRTEEGA